MFGYIYCVRVVSAFARLLVRMAGLQCETLQQFGKMYTRLAEITLNFANEVSADVKTPEDVRQLCKTYLEEGRTYSLYSLLTKNYQPFANLTKVFFCSPRAFFHSKTIRAAMAERFAVTSDDELKTYNTKHDLPADFCSQWWLDNVAQFQCKELLRYNPNSRNLLSYCTAAAKIPSPMLIGTYLHNTYGALLLKTFCEYALEWKGKRLSYIIPGRILNKVMITIATTPDAIAVPHEDLFLQSLDTYYDHDENGATLPYVATDATPYALLELKTIHRQNAYVTREETQHLRNIHTAHDTRAVESAFSGVVEKKLIAADALPAKHTQKRKNSGRLLTDTDLGIFFQRKYRFIRTSALRKLQDTTITSSAQTIKPLPHIFSCIGDKIRLCDLVDVSKCQYVLFSEDGNTIDFTLESDSALLLPSLQSEYFIQLLTQYCTLWHLKETVRAVFTVGLSYADSPTQLAVAYSVAIDFKPELRNRFYENVGKTIYLAEKAVEEKRAIKLKHIGYLFNNPEITQADRRQYLYNSSSNNNEKQVPSDTGENEKKSFSLSDDNDDDIDELLRSIPM